MKGRNSGAKAPGILKEPYRRPEGLLHPGALSCIMGLKRPEGPFDFFALLSRSGQALLHPLCGEGLDLQPSCAEGLEWRAMSSLVSSAIDERFDRAGAITLKLQGLQECQFLPV
jgi:hypothetical protein